MFDPASVRFRGPLVPHIDGFWSELMRQGYAPFSGRNLLLVAAHLSRWLDDRKLGTRDLTCERVAQFAAHRRRQGYTHFLTPQAVEPLLAYLRRVGAVPPPLPPQDTPLDRFLREYADHLAAERGLRAPTVGNYCDCAERFAEAMFDDGRLAWQRLLPADIARFVLGEAHRWSPRSCQCVTTALRSLLRYLRAGGQIERDLASCVPAVASWRLAWLPKGLGPDQVQRVLQATKPGSVVGRRDAAIILLLLRLGLRAGDVAALTLADLDWRRGEIVLRGKGRHEDRLPLPRDVGRVLATYLWRGRPRSASRQVFLRGCAPYTPLLKGGVIAVAGRALRRAGIAGGAHVLRHTVATGMLRAGASLSEIGHVLRHRHPDTTAIYAKVDFAALRTVVQPWPVGAP